MTTTWGGKPNRESRRAVASAALAGAAIASLALAGLAFQHHSTALGVFGLVLCVALVTAADVVGADLPPSDPEVEVVDEHGHRLPAKLLPPRRPIRIGPGVYQSRQSGTRR